MFSNAILLVLGSLSSLLTSVIHLGMQRRRDETARWRELRVETYLQFGIAHKKVLTSLATADRHAAIDRQESFFEQVALLGTADTLKSADLAKRAATRFSDSLDSSPRTDSGSQSIIQGSDGTRRKMDTNQKLLQYEAFRAITDFYVTARSELGIEHVDFSKVTIPHPSDPTGSPDFNQ